MVWEDWRNGNADIYGYSLSTREEFRITKDQNDQVNPEIYGVIVVWEDNRNGNWDIYLTGNCQYYAASSFFCLINSYEGGP